MAAFVSLQGPHICLLIQNESSFVRQRGCSNAQTVLGRAGPVCPALSPLGDSGQAVRAPGLPPNSGSRRSRDRWILCPGCGRGPEAQGLSSCHEQTRTATPAVIQSLLLRTHPSVGLLRAVPEITEQQCLFMGLHQFSPAA